MTGMVEHGRNYITLKGGGNGKYPKSHNILLKVQKIALITTGCLVSTLGCCFGAKQQAVDDFKRPAFVQERWAKYKRN
jgi:hypothetical protein